jgi:hypothetical protein
MGHGRRRVRDDATSRGGGRPDGRQPVRSTCEREQRRTPARRACPVATDGGVARRRLGRARGIRRSPRGARGRASEGRTTGGARCRRWVRARPNRNPGRGHSLDVGPARRGAAPSRLAARRTCRHRRSPVPAPPATRHRGTSRRPRVLGRDGHASWRRARVMGRRCRPCRGRREHPARTPVSTEAGLPARLALRATGVPTVSRRRNSPSGSDVARLLAAALARMGGGNRSGMGASGLDPRPSRRASASSTRGPPPRRGSPRRSRASGPHRTAGGPSCTSRVLPSPHSRSGAPAGPGSTSATRHSCPTCSPSPWARRSTSRTTTPPTTTSSRSRGRGRSISGDTPQGDRARSPSIAPGSCASSVTSTRT